MLPLLMQVSDGIMGGCKEEKQEIYSAKNLRHLKNSILLFAFALRKINIFVGSYAVYTCKQIQVHIL